MTAANSWTVWFEHWRFHHGICMGILAIVLLIGMLW